MSLRLHKRQLAISLATVLALIIAWSVATYFDWLPALYLPSPLSVVRKTLELIQHGYMDASFWQHLSASLGRVFLALLIAVVAGVPLGILIGVNPNAHAAIDPLIEFYRPVPPLAYLPLIVIWFGIGEFSKVLLIALAIFAPVVVTTANGVRAVNPLWIRSAKTLGASRWQVIHEVILPGAFPDILTGVRIGLGLGWSTLVAAELIAATEGLGFLIQSASQFLITDLVITGILFIAIIAYAMEIGLRIIQQRLVPWKGKNY
jgi:taurine transport system permease protein